MQIKGLVLAGGAGTRLRPITHTRAKQLVPIAGKPVLFYCLEALKAAGIEDVGIIVGDTAAEIEAAVGDGSAFGLSVTYIRQEGPLGLAHAVSVARPFLGASPFCMYLGDNLLIDGVRAFVDEFRSTDAEAMILLQEVDDPRAFGVAELVDGRVTRLAEKPASPVSNLALVGVYLFRESVHEVIAGLRPSARGEYEITEAIQGLIDRGHRVEPHIVTGWWKDTGQLDDVLEANRLVLDTLEHRVDGDVIDSRIEGRVVIEAEATVTRCHIRGPAYIGSRTRVTDAFVGPYSAISADVEFSDAEIEHSIVLERSRIVGLQARIEDSLIGTDVVIIRSSRRPAAHRLMLGDQSQVELL